MLELIGSDDSGIRHVELRESIKPVIERLPERQKQILMLRFFAHQSQSEIAAQIGISQMHVSRLLSRSLETIRAALEDQD
jgi:RNA polymerase sigma-B factor